MKSVYNKIQCFNYCTKNSPKNKLYSKTVFLPKTDFPLKLLEKKLIDRDENINKVLDAQNLYLWQRGHLNEPEFVLHDGPPYANGKPHMGHAINKILKDTILRYNILNGNKVHFVPGWDCHGLPIELKASTNTKNQTAIEIRTKARNFAKTTIENQKHIFRSWGLIGDWDNYYATYNPNYVKTQLRIFNKLYKKNLIYRDFKPIYWSPSSKTALAESELEYNEKHKSPSVYLRCKIEHFPRKTYDNSDIFALIWTTTPWTLPSNQTICYNPFLEYTLIKNKKNDIYIVAKDLIEEISKIMNENFDILEHFSGQILSQCTYIHPIDKNKRLNFIPSSHATNKKGTGLVHTAPAHGPEDFLVAINNKLPIVNLVNSLGCYNEKAGINLEGKFVLTDGNRAVLDLIKDDLLHVGDFIHSYPYDWRTKKPVIIRASEQWFVNTEMIKNQALEALENVEIIPNINSRIYKSNLINQIQKRPYWCISRQRKWGVPIPVFFKKSTQEIMINDDLISHYCELIDKYGTDFWWKLSDNQLLSPIQQRDNLVKSEDILDIWFDSGISWTTALEGDKIADMYLEGVDQFNGWFQSSLLTSVALRNKAPYKKLYIHGFAVDENGMKMSKSLGNVVDPVDIVKGGKGRKTYGIDVLRWWVCCHANQDSVTHIGKNVLQSSDEDIQKIRSTLRFVLGALNDSTPNPLEYDQLTIMDKYFLHLLSNYHDEVQEAVRNFQFNRVCVTTIHFLTNAVSALYYTAIKDRLYCDLFDSPQRRACQYVLSQLFEIVSQAIAPIVPHLIEEMYTHLPRKYDKSYFMNEHNRPGNEWKNPQLNGLMELIMDVRRELHKQNQNQTLDCVLKLDLSEENWNVLINAVELDDFQKELEDILQVSAVQIEKKSIQQHFVMKITKTNKYMCDRCRRMQSLRQNELCKRCEEVLEIFNKKAVSN